MQEMWHHALAGAVAGTASAVATAPLDLAKTQLQAANANYTLAQVFKHTIHTHGVKGLFNGLGACLLGLVPSWAIYFTAYTHIKGALHCSSSTATHITAAMGAGAINAVLTNPLWVVKVRMQTMKNKYPNIHSTFNTIIKEEGYAGLLKGMPLSILGTTHIAIQFPLYEHLKAAFKRNSTSNAHTHSTNIMILDEYLQVKHILVSSIASKLVASSITYPHELVRTRFQRQQTKQYHSIYHAVQTIAKEEGILAFYKGMGTNLLRVIPTSSITFVVYETCIKYLATQDPLIYSSNLL
jgi:solute carrier family 25 folate transporter 32